MMPCQQSDEAMGSDEGSGGSGSSGISGHTEEECLWDKGARQKLIAVW